MPRIVLQDLETGKTQTVSETEATIGRDPACGFVIEGPKSKVVSGRHARVFFQDASWWIEDTSRNGTVLDNERLQAGQRHAIRTGQLIGLGESGPRLRVTTLESRKVAETVIEAPEADKPAPSEVQGSVPRPGVSAYVPPPVVEPAYPDNTTAIRRSEALRAGVKFEEATEPMSPAPDWQVQVSLRSTTSDQRFDITAMSVKIGRSPECNVQIPAELGASVSRIHAEILIEDGGVVIRDAGSRNGTFVNGKRLDAPHQAAKRDLIMLGSGGPTLAIEDLHIVKGAESPASGEVPVPASRGEPTPADARPARERSAAPLGEPRTEPAPISDPKNSVPRDPLDEASTDSTRRVRTIVWAAVITTLAIAAVLLLVLTR